MQSADLVVFALDVLYFKLKRTKRHDGIEPLTRPLTHSLAPFPRCGTEYFCPIFKMFETLSRCRSRGLPASGKINYRLKESHKASGASHEPPDILHQISSILRN